MKNGCTEELLLAVAVANCGSRRQQQLVEHARQAGSFRSVAGFIGARERDHARMAVEQSYSLGLTVADLFSSLYPELLRAIDSPPPVLFVRESVPGMAFRSLGIGVVGTRSASVEVCGIAADFGRELADAGITVVSGLALGIDGAAHRGALEARAECPTIAVLAHGLDRIYPASHHGLAQRIIGSGGALVSEYPPGTEPMKHHFLARNRIIAGLSRGIVVVQAGARSGSLVTAQFAADYGRDVFIVGTGEECERNAGGLSMIEQGARSIRSASEVLHEYGRVSSVSQHESEWRVVAVDELSREMNLTQKDLLQWELDGTLVRLAANKARVRL